MKKQDTSQLILPDPLLKPPGGAGLSPGGAGLSPGGAGLSPGGAGVSPGGAGLVPGGGSVTTHTNSFGPPQSCARSRRA